MIVELGVRFGMEINDWSVDVLRWFGGWNANFRDDGRSHWSSTSFNICKCDGTDWQRDHRVLIECANFLNITFRIRTGGRQQLFDDVYFG